MHCEFVIHKINLICIPSAICTVIGSLKGPLPTELTAATLTLYTVPNTRSFKYRLYTEVEVSIGFINRATQSRG